MVILNLKTYPESTGSKLKETLEDINQVLIENPGYKENLYVALQVMDLAGAIALNSGVNLISQHVDAKESGKSTGMLPAERLLDSGITTSLFNHSEHRVDQGTILDSINFIQGFGIKLIVCCENTVEAEKLLAVKPFAIAYEPPELIGSGKSVSSEQPDIVKEFVALLRNSSSPETKAIIGAGVSTGNDIKACKQLGADGVLLASAFAALQDPTQKKLILAEFMKAWE